MLDRDDVAGCFTALLGRPPESPAVVEHFRAFASIGELVAALMTSEEFLRRNAKGPFDFPNASFDAVATVRRHEDGARRPREGCFVNYFGVAIPQEVVPAGARGAVPLIEADPLPANWHADTAEFAGALRAVELSGTMFTVVELGCGWGCWMTITGLAARRAGKRVRLVGVEGDRRNFDLAVRALGLNGFGPEDYVLHHGIAHARSGTALFPQQGAGDDAWGLAPVFPQDEDAYALATASGRAAELPMIAFAELAARHGRIDLLHVDIQGGERDLVNGCLDAFGASVAYVLIGTHGREIEGELFAAFRGAGWQLEIERPAILDVSGPTVRVDGIQGWRNRRLT